MYDTVSKFDIFLRGTLVPMIIGEIRRFLRDNNAVRISRSMRDLAYHAMQVKERLQKENGREPRFSEIADQVDSTPENVAVALEAIASPSSIYEPMYSDGDESVTLADQLKDYSGEESWISEIMFRDGVRALSVREREILFLRYLKGRTQTEVAQVIGISQAQVSRLEKNAIRHLKEEITV